MAFSSAVMSPEHALSVIDRALDYREESSVSTRDRLNSAINATVNLPGFRDTSVAPRQQLREPIFTAFLSGQGDKLATEVLRAWTEANGSLKSVVTEYLRSREVPVDGPDLQRGVFRAIWPRHEWTAEAERIANGTSDGRFNGDDIALMLCCVSGRVPTLEPTLEMESPLFQKWLDELSDLPPEAPEWDHVDEFTSSLKGLALEKIKERVTVQIEALSDSITEVRDEFVDELRYLELNLSSWSADDVARAGLLETALNLAIDLKSALSEYRPIRPQGPSRSEELLRAPERTKYEKVIIDIVEAWDEMMMVPETTVDQRTPDESLDEVQGEANKAALEIDSVGADDSAGHEPGSLDADLDLLRKDNETLVSENHRLKQNRADLQEDKAKLGERISRLRRELSQSREMQEHWRKGYVLASAGQVRPESEQAVQLSSVNDALELAEKSFPDRIRLALNSKSNSVTPFQKPDEVFDALAWLATDYHRLRTSPGDAPNFDKLLKEACPGWSYKPKQTEVTKDQFTEWYTTTHDGKSYELDAHIGKGTSFDPHLTIRIAFDWDDELKQVIVGFVGRHQKNRNS